MPINIRNKGANGEREVVNLLTAEIENLHKEMYECSGILVKCPELIRNTHQSAIGGEDIAGLPFYSVEVKRCEKVELGKWWLQTTRQSTIAPKSKFTPVDTTSVTRYTHEVSIDGSKKLQNYYVVGGQSNEKIPLLFYRQNNRPWNIMMFGYVDALNGMRIRTPVEISLNAFISWMRLDYPARIASALAAHPDFKDAPPDFDGAPRKEGSPAPIPLPKAPATKKEREPDPILTPSTEVRAAPWLRG